MHLNRHQEMRIEGNDHHLKFQNLLLGKKLTVQIQDKQKFIKNKIKGEEKNVHLQNLILFQERKRNVLQDQDRDLSRPNIKRKVGQNHHQLRKFKEVLNHSGVKVQRRKIRIKAFQKP